MIFKITPSKTDKNFIKVNKDTLNDMFSRWLWDMKVDALEMSADTEEERIERDRAILAIKFIESILKTIKIVTTVPEESNDNFI
jgi:hypothetical protein